MACFIVRIVRILLLLILVLRAAGAATYTASCAGATSTTAENAAAQTLLNNAILGDTVMFEAGCAFETGSGIGFRIPRKTTGSGYLTITSTCDTDGTLPAECSGVRLPAAGTPVRITPHFAAQMATFRSTARSIFIECSPPADNIRIRGIIIEGNSNAAQNLTIGCAGASVGGRTATSSSDQPSNILIEHVLFRLRNWDIRSQAAYVLFAANNSILQHSYFSGAWKVGTEVQHILVLNAPGPMRILNSALMDAAGENIMFGGTGASYHSNSIPSGVFAWNSAYNHPERLVGMKSRAFEWSAASRYFRGAALRAPSSGRFFWATNTGTSGSIPPDWSAVPSGGTIIDGTITWRHDGTGTSTSAPKVLKNLFETKNSQDLDNMFNQFRGFTPQAQENIITYKISAYPFNRGVNGQRAPFMTGRVNVSGTTVTSADGNPLPKPHLPWVTGVSGDWPPYQIRINGSFYTVSGSPIGYQPPLDNYTLYLTSSPGTLTNVIYEWGNADVPQAAMRRHRFASNIIEDSNWGGAYTVQMQNAPEHLIYSNAFENNLFRRIDCTVWGGGGASPCAASRGFAWFALGVPGTDFQHNTIIDSSNARNAGLYITDDSNAGLGLRRYRGNLWPTSSGAAIAPSDGDAGTRAQICNDINCTSAAWGFNIVSGGKISNFSFGGPMYNLCTSTAACSSPDFDSIFQRWDLRLLKPKTSSIAFRGGPDRTPIGADYQLLPIVRNPSSGAEGPAITPTSDSALFEFWVHNSLKDIGCSIEISTTDDMDTLVAVADPNTLSDLHNSYPRSGLRRTIRVSGLSASTTYYYRLHCGSITEGSFSTISTGNSASTISASVAPRASGNHRIVFGSVYSRAADAFTGASAGASSWTYCSVDTQCTLAALAPAGISWWRVESEAGHKWPLGSAVSLGIELPPSAPSLISPGADAVGVSITPTLSWSAAPNATSYRVYFGPTSPPAYVATTANLSYAVGTLLNDTLYHWRVVARNSAGDAESEIRSFTTIPVVDPCPGAPAAPTLVSPAAGATNIALDALLNWTPADACATSFDVYFGTSSPPSLSTNIPGTQFGPSLSEDTLYYWRVGSRNSHGVTLSAIRSFRTIDIAEPPATYYVDQNDPDCADSAGSPGSSAAPFCAISTAANRLQPGQTVVVRAGIYREHIAPRLGGNSESSRITYRGTPGANVSVRGSEPYPTWVADGPIWKAEIDNSFFATYCGSGPGTPSGGWNPFNQVHAGYCPSCTGAALNGYLKYGLDITLGGVYLDDVPLLQAVRNPGDDNFVVGDRADVVANANTWTSCVSNRHPLANGTSKACGTPGGAVGKTVIWANFGTNPTVGTHPITGGARVEINCRQAIIDPATWNGKNDDAAATESPTGRNYITIKNFDLRHAAARWTYLAEWGRGLLSTNWSKGWIIENNHISDSTGECITMHHPRSFAGWASGSGGPIGMDGATINIGGHIIRNNIIERCGSNAIHSNRGGIASTIERNLIQDTNPGGRIGGYETAGIKLHQSLDIIVDSNVIRRTHSKYSALGVSRPSGGNLVHTGIWLDTGFQGSRITGNIVYDIADQILRLEAGAAGITLIDGNFFVVGPTIFSSQSSAMPADWGIDIAGAQTILAHNMFVGPKYRFAETDNCSPIYRPHTSDQIGGTRRPHTDGSWYWGNIATSIGTLNNVPGINYGASAGSSCSIDFTAAHPSNFRTNYNVFWQGAQKSTVSGYETASRVSTFNPTFSVSNIQSGGSDAGARVGFCANSETLSAVSVPRVTGVAGTAGSVPLNSSIISTNAGVDQTIETHAGTPITLSLDIRGITRGATSLPGPFASYDTTTGACANKNNYTITASGPQ